MFEKTTNDQAVDQLVSPKIQSCSQKWFVVACVVGSLFVASAIAFTVIGLTNPSAIGTIGQTPHLWGLWAISGSGLTAGTILIVYGAYKLKNKKNSLPKENKKLEIPKKDTSREQKETNLVDAAPSKQNNLQGNEKVEIPEERSPTDSAPQPFVPSKRINLVEFDAAKKQKMLSKEKIDKVIKHYIGNDYPHAPCLEVKEEILEEIKRISIRQIVKLTNKPLIFKKVKSKLPNVSDKDIEASISDLKKKCIITLIKAMGVIEIGKFYDQHSQMSEQEFIQKFEEYRNSKEFLEVINKQLKAIRIRPEYNLIIQNIMKNYVDVMIEAIEKK